MSRVHDALRKAEKSVAGQPPSPEPRGNARPPIPGYTPPGFSPPGGTSTVATVNDSQSLEGMLDLIQEIPYAPSREALLINAIHPDEAPAEEFRTLRTRLNHMQSLQPIHTAVITSPSPAEGKSFAAMNFAMAEAQLAGNYTLLCDFDFRRPIIHNMLKTDRSPGITDYLLGKIPLHQAIRRVAGTNLFIMPAGEAVINPLELLNLKEVKQMLDRLPSLFNWVILDSPPLLFAADANLLGTLCHGTILVVRIGSTTIDSITRAMQSLCQNNVLGIIVNGARRGELYSKYTYYHSYYSPKDGEKKSDEDDDE